jgi:hypothetical protein
VVTVVALQSFVLDERQIHEGEAIDLEPVMAAVHGRLGHVSLDPMTKATYQTRHLTAQFVMPAATPPLAMPVTAIADLPKPKRRRTRKRKA